MSQNNLAYPYPVLTAYSDDVQPALAAQNVQVGEMQIINNDYVLPLTLILEDPKLLQLIAEGKAEYMFDVNCPASLYRRCINSNHNEVEITFPFKRVSGVAKIRPYVIAKTAFTYEEYAIAIAKDNTELLEEINAAIAELEASGELKAIIDKYITAE